MKPKYTTFAALLAVCAVNSASLAADGPSGPSGAPPPATSEADTEARLAAAREQLEKAAREVAALSTQLGMSAGEHVRFGRDWSRGVIGLQLDPASGKEGARVAEVSPGGPAAEAGVRAGDVIVALNGAPIAGENTARQVVERMRETAPDTKVKLRLTREGKPLEVAVTTRASNTFAFSTPFGDGTVHLPPPGLIESLPDFRTFRGLGDEMGGMELATLSPTLGQYFGTEKGVLVVRAPEGQAFHLRDGDVILAIDGREPKNGSHATRILRSYQPGEKVALKVMRQKKPLTLEMTMPASSPPPPPPPGIPHGEEGPVIRSPPPPSAMAGRPAAL
jgi:predicted metalloprotease with PDZ domain